MLWPGKKTSSQGCSFVGEIEEVRFDNVPAPYEQPNMTSSTT